MAYTDQTLANDSYEALRVLNPALPPSSIPRIRVLIPSALELMAVRVKDSDGYEGLQQDFTATPTAGRLDLAALTGILFDIERARVRIASSGVLIQTIDKLETLEHGGLPTDRVYVAQDGQELIFRSITPSLTDYATQVKIKSNYVPSLTGADNRPLPVSLEGLALATVVELGSRNMTALAEAKESAAVGRA